MEFCKVASRQLSCCEELKLGIVFFVDYFLAAWLPVNLIFYGFYQQRPNGGGQVAHYRGGGVVPGSALSWCPLRSDCNIYAFRNMDILDISQGSSDFNNPSPFIVFYMCVYFTVTWYNRVIVILDLKKVTLKVFEGGLWCHSVALMPDLGGKLPACRRELQCPLPPTLDVSFGDFFAVL